MVPLGITLLDELANIGQGDETKVDSSRNLILVFDIIDGKLQLIFSSSRHLGARVSSSSCIGPPWMAKDSAEVRGLVII